MTMQHFSTRFAVLVIWLWGSVNFAGDAEQATAVWPQWRGPHRDGVAQEKGAGADGVGSAALSEDSGAEVANDNAAVGGQNAVEH